MQQKIAEYRQKLAAQPESRVFAPLAELLHETGQTDEALALLSAGVERHPHYLSAQVVQARVFLATGQRDRAVSVLRCVLARDGQNVVALSLLTDEYLATERETDAAELLRKLVTLDPDQPRWPGELARLEASGRIDQPGRDGFATMTLVDIYLQQGYRRPALAALYTILAREPERRDVQIRIDEIEAAAAAERADPDRAAHQARDTDRSTPGDATAKKTRSRPSAEALRKGDRRAEEKRRFSEWLASFETERGEQE